jgi:bla regulator protein blaR1
MIPGIVAHLWQSTLFAGAAGIAALALRPNRAQVRYWVWFIASAKFVIPFSLLVGLGALVPRHGTGVPVRTDWVAALKEFSQPLALPTVGAHVAVTAGGADHGFLAAAALVLWACGFGAVATCWLLRWRRVHALRRSARAVSLPAGVEIPVPTMSTPGLIEPGVFGVLRPVLLLPEGIAGRLVDERERACDEEGLRLGCKPNVYTESILMVCKLYLSSPLACVSGVTGSDLKKTNRIDHEKPPCGSTEPWEKACPGSRRDGGCHSADRRWGPECARSLGLH